MKCKNTIDNFTVGKEYQAILDTAERLLVVNDIHKSELLLNPVWSNAFERQ